ncbi:hypothetical protein PV328_004237 [Microctonus aethiopoides]|uniref:Uncharacterized protein n=1 Tax=Microctonus aethiopoides TaxID=144406 RepID=A0AA39FA25_9HYME|nr:hypothetical protein PV328_004237 [Microctonus aethiopoides]
MGLRRAKRKMLENEADETIRTSNITVIWNNLYFARGYFSTSDIFANNVELCDFLQKHALVGFYGFNELQVKDLLEKAGLGDNLEKVRDMYDGYETTLKNGLNIHLYSPWAVIKYLMTKQFSKYWSSGIPKRIEEALGNPKIATKIRKIMPGESVRIEYHGKLEIKHIDALNNMIWKNEINKCHEFFNHDLKLIKKFTNSGEALAKSCKNRRVDIKGYGRIKDKVRILAINIGTMFYNAKGRPRNEQEFQSALYIYLNLQFDYVACQCITRDDNVCDIIVVIENVMFVIECKNFYKSAVKAHDQIIVKGYFTLAETASLEYIFGDSMPTVQDIIRLGIHINRDCKTSIACLFADTKMKIINSR